MWVCIDSQGNVRSETGLFVPPSTFYSQSRAKCDFWTQLLTKA